ncbi:MAG: hypothetical protein CMD96_04170 [Gammaproteobacteria bacterium]|nr:hypothetical protein [Gammaproteobacteria bacterium]HJP17531.1 diguanylate cyclase [Nitrospinota bacterium]
MSGSGFKFLLAKNGKEAVEIATLEKPDLITMDINMPVMDGYEACLQLITQQDTSNIPIIILTTNNTREEREKGFEVGATEYFTKPFAKGHLSAYIKHLLSELKSERTEKVLIAEDDFIAQQIFKNYMKKYGFGCEIVGDGKKALEVLENGFQPAAVILDCLMPVMDGIDTCRILKKNEAYRHIPVIMVTSAKNKDDIIAGLEAGADDYITKPFDGDELIARLEAHIRNYSLVRKLKESENQFKSSFENAPLGMALVALDHRLISVNKVLCEITGLSAEELLATSFPDITHPDENDYSFIQEMIEKKNSLFQGEMKWIHKSGKILSILLNVSLLRGTDGHPIHFIFEIQDITKQKEAESQIQLAAKIYENIMDGIIVTDRKGNIEIPNPAFLQMTGYCADETIGKNPKFLKSGRHEPAFYKEVWGSLANTGQWHGEIWNRRKDGEVFLTWARINSIEDNKGVPTHFVAIYSDITARKLQEKRLEYLANHDALTGLPNRIFFRDILDQGLARSKRFKDYVVLMFIDLDKFKPINDSLGHEAGDAVLKEVAVRLKNCVRQSDTVSRLGGDEFVVILQDVKKKEGASIIARKMLESLSRSFKVHDNECNIGASIGISISPLDSEDAEVLISNADAAMYRVKEKGRNDFLYFHDIS